MSKFSDPVYLAGQYRDTTNLDARVALHRRFSTNLHGWHRWVFDRLRLPAATDILELGCGPGHLWGENLDRVPAGWQMLLSDHSIGMARAAKERLARRGQRFRFGAVDAQALPFPDRCFDVVIANHMLYHVPDRPQAYSEIHRVLRPGGRLYASTVGSAHLRELRALVARFVPGSGAWGSPPVAFLLENGAEQLAPWFGQIALHRYEDDLVVTEADPLIAYILSSSAQATPTESALLELRQFLEQQLDDKGAIHITKDSGLFEALRKG